MVGSRKASTRIRRGSDAVFGNQPDEMFERAVVGFFGVLRETAPGEFPALEMVLEALAADPFAMASRVGAVAAFEVRGLFAFHGVPPQEMSVHTGGAFQLPASNDALIVADDRTFSNRTGGGTAPVQQNYFF
jgi:hypothetical protein